MEIPSSNLYFLLDLIKKALGLLLLGNGIAGLWFWKSQVQQAITLHLRQILSLVVVVTSGIIGGQMATTLALDPMLVK